jgi:D-glycero-D-manno-heptose 1,7-bisphosphate phosphatase
VGVGEIGVSRRAVFLDRDGVLNRAVIRDGKPYPPQTVAEVEMMPEAPACLAKLKAAGFLLLVVTNQPDVARGTQTRETVESINASLAARMPIDGFYVCYHDSADGCHCRKPKPGLLTDAAAEHSIDLAASFMIGDRYRDVEAAQAAGCFSVWIDYGYAEREPKRPADARVHSITDATDYILATI